MNEDLSQNQNTLFLLRTETLRVSKQALLQKQRYSDNNTELYLLLVNYVQIGIHMEAASMAPTLCPYHGMSAKQWLRFKKNGFYRTKKVKERLYKTWKIYMSNIHRPILETLLKIKTLGVSPETLYPAFL